PHRLHAQATGDVLVERADLAALHARRRLHLEAGDHRPRVGADHLHLDPEVLELELDLPRQRLQGFLGPALDLLLRLVQQGQRRQVALAAGVEQGNLLLAPGPFGFLDDRAWWRRNLDRFALGPLLGFALADLLALL